MPIQTTASLIFWDTIGGIIKNLPWFILIIYSTKKIVKEMPKWIQQVFNEMTKAKVLDGALKGK